ncbi:FAS1-like dehydratase domain-containing protein [Kineobactrum salinum]|uniref:MaoC family dehydratase n=1 Tax=Kineobactrum salinum TaxID=2708301 RepID=A0A6C0U6B2_9GAMM|nr:MaoC family dehydratase N-terminal domain-containing protein [Kineobactrum salinum]QIB67403.1 MaoC family dehydratase [Kineobactrum salinum]
MSDSSGQTGIKCLFNRDTKGQSTSAVKVQVERGRIQFFSKVLGFDDPVHTSLKAARAQGHPDLVAPPSFYMVVEAAADEERRQRGEMSSAELVGCDFRYLLHGDEYYTYDGLIYAGDEVSIVTKVIDFYEKKGGTLEFVTFESLITHADRGALVRGGAPFFIVSANSEGVLQ